MHVGAAADTVNTIVPPAGLTSVSAEGATVIVLIMVLCITNVYVKYLNKAKER